MITKEQFAANIHREIDIIKHLFEKIPANQEHYKPTEQQRTILELLGYLANGPYRALKAIRANDTSVFDTMQPKEVTLANFISRMDEESLEIGKELEAMSDEEINESIDLWKNGFSFPRSQYLLQMVLESFVAYKMQLFLYIKSAGNTDINTSNLWQGRDNR